MDGLCVLARYCWPITGLEEQIQRFFQQRLDRSIFLDHDAAQLFGDSGIEITADMFAASSCLFFPGRKIAGRSRGGLAFKRACELVGYDRLPA
jgi:hypothetical protein